MSSEGGNFSSASLKYNTALEKEKPKAFRRLSDGWELSIDGVSVKVGHSATNLFSNLLGTFSKITLFFSLDISSNFLPI